MSAPRFTVVGDGIENPWNARTLRDAAELFGADCLFHEHAAGSRAVVDAALGGQLVRSITPAELASGYRPIVALENVPGAVPVYGFRPPAGPAPALIAGNERRGVGREMLELADVAVEIPMPSRHLNCLNVAAAAAVALYYLTGYGGGTQRFVPNPGKLRPDLLLLAPVDHVELGSSLRSAGAFGWERVFVEDRHGVWFGVDRSLRAEGRAAARRSRNPIRVIPAALDQIAGFEQVCVITPEPRGRPLSRANLAGGGRQLVVIPDAEGVDLDVVDWERLGKRVSFASLDLPCRPAMPHYRLEASIALAEIARQIGRPSVPTRKRPSPAPRYHRVLRLGAPQAGELVYFDELERY